jgi:hypothetical protein
MSSLSYCDSSHIPVPSLIVLGLNDDPSHLTTPGLIPSLLPLILLVLICLWIQPSLALFITVPDIDHHARA